MLFCNTVVNTGPWTVLRYNVCTGCCVGWETRGHRWNGGALRNAAMRETQFQCREAALLLSLSLSHLVYTCTHSLVHVDARTCLLNSRSQTHSSPHFLCMQEPSGVCCKMNVSVNIFSTFTAMFPHYFHLPTVCLKATWRSSSLTINRPCVVPIFRNIFPGAQNIMHPRLFQFQAFRVCLSIETRNCIALITPQWQQYILKWLRMDGLNIHLITSPGRT